MTLPDREHLFAHTVTRVINSDSSKGPIEDRLESSSGGSFDLMSAGRITKALVVHVANLHNLYEEMSSFPSDKAKNRLNLNFTNRELPESIQDPKHSIPT